MYPGRWQWNVTSTWFWSCFTCGRAEVLYCKWRVQVPLYVALTTVFQSGSSCEIESFHSDVAKYSSLRGCDAVLLASNSWNVKGLFCLFMQGIFPVKTSSKCDSKLNFSNCSLCFVSATLHSNCKYLQFNCVNIFPLLCKK